MATPLQLMQQSMPARQEFEQRLADSLQKIILRFRQSFLVLHEALSLSGNTRQIDADVRAMSTYQMNLHRHVDVFKVSAKIRAAMNKEFHLYGLDVPWMQHKHVTKFTDEANASALATSSAETIAAAAAAAATAAAVGTAGPKTLLSSRTFNAGTTNAVHRLKEKFALIDANTRLPPKTTRHSRRSVVATAKDAATTRLILAAGHTPTPHGQILPVASSRFPTIQKSEADKSQSGGSGAQPKPTRPGTAPGAGGLLLKLPRLNLSAVSQQFVTAAGTYLTTLNARHEASQRAALHFTEHGGSSNVLDRVPQPSRTSAESDLPRTGSAPPHRPPRALHAESEQLHPLTPGTPVSTPLPPPTHRSLSAIPGPRRSRTTAAHRVVSQGGAGAAPIPQGSDSHDATSPATVWPDSHAQSFNRVTSFKKTSVSHTSPRLKPTIQYNPFDNADAPPPFLTDLARAIPPHHTSTADLVLNSSSATIARTIFSAMTGSSIVSGDSDVAPPIQPSPSLTTTAPSTANLSPSTDPRAFPFPASLKFPAAFTEARALFAAAGFPVKPIVRSRAPAVGSTRTASTTSDDSEGPEFNDFKFFPSFSDLPYLPKAELEMFPTMSMPKMLEPPIVLKGFSSLVTFFSPALSLTMQAFSCNFHTRNHCFLKSPVERARYLVVFSSSSFIPVV